MLSILAWWAIPVGAVLSATVAAAIARRVRRSRADVGMTRRYQRAREVLARTQRPLEPKDAPTSPTETRT